MKYLILSVFCISLTFSVNAQVEQPLPDPFVVERDSAYSVFLSQANIQSFDTAEGVNDYKPYLLEGYEIYNTAMLQHLVYKWQLPEGGMVSKQNDTDYYQLDGSEDIYFKVSEYTARKKAINAVQMEVLHTTMYSCTTSANLL